MSTQVYASVPDDGHMTSDETAIDERWDDTGPIIGDLRDRPAIEIKLRDVFIDPHLRVSQRIFCLGKRFMNLFFATRPTKGSIRGAQRQEMAHP
ncbi:unnamed protein product [Strongylus vulgaris]|uniref:Uncharacterized protein n=1 Tax=Strongylus vulgaris TaxID=40348 RepID=A0A3P7M1E9_STRVU|nr:unnamed protein product [Strongylus vulgaris]